jgi:hypothetical protein
MAAFAVVHAAAVLARHRAEAAADLAALAGAGRIGVAADECEVAARVASENRASLRRCDLELAPDGRAGTVRVTVYLAAALPVVGTRGVDASARAARLPVAVACWPDPGQCARIAQIGWAGAP